jgi:predicted PurR-regulated permease PerM
MIFNSKEPITFDRAFRIVGTILIVILLFMLIRHLSSVLTPFFIAITAAYIINPVVDFFQFKLKVKKRGLSVLFTLIFIGLLFWSAVAVVKPLVRADFAKATIMVEKYSKSQIQSYSNPVQKEVYRYINTVSNNKEIMNWLKGQDVGVMIKKVTSALGGIASTSFALIAGILSVFLALLYFVFALLQYNDFFGKWREMIPEKYQATVKDIFEDVQTAMKQYFRAQTLVAFIVGILFAIGFSIVGIPMAVVFGLFVGMLNLIPYLQLIALLPATALALLHSLETGQEFYVVLLLVLLVFAVVQLIQDGFLVPKIMGKATGMSAVVVLLALSVWGTLLGFVGLFLAIPLTSLVLSYYKRIVVKEESLIKD